MSSNNIIETNGDLITVEELSEQLDSAGDHEMHDLTIINVLTKQQFNDCRIKKSINIELESLENVVADWDRNRKIVVYSESYECPLSEEACDKLIQMGFTHVHVFEGGIKEWTEMGYPTEGACKMDYLTD